MDTGENRVEQIVYPLETGRLISNKEMTEKNAMDDEEDDASGPARIANGAVNGRTTLVVSKMKLFEAPRLPPVSLVDRES